MKKIFTVGQMFEIPDGTKVSLLLNPLDSNQKDLRPEILPEMSIAAGEIPPAIQSKIHLHPLVSQVTWVIKGQLHIKMKGERDRSAYTLDLATNQAVLTESCTFFQLINLSASASVRVLYLVAPAYVFKAEDSRVRYDDALVLDDTWDTLAERRWRLPQCDDLVDIARERKRAIKRIVTKKLAKQLKPPENKQPKLNNNSSR